MALFHPASRRWADRHFVLTKSGFLHWFTSAEELEPLDALALHRCQFESSAEDATLTISEAQGGVAHVRLSCMRRGLWHSSYQLSLARLHPATRVLQYPCCAAATGRFM